MMAELVIWGAGGHAKVVFDTAKAVGYTRVRFVDDCAAARPALYGCAIAAPPVDSQLTGAAVEFAVEFMVAIGDNRARARCYARALQLGWTPATLIHPSAEVSPHSEISPGCVVLPRAVINAGALVGPNSIINTGAIVEHDCRLSSHVHISPAATLGGAVEVGAFALVGIGACVLPGCRIGADSIVGAGAVVLASIPDAVTAAGIPARILSRSKAGAR
jgi:sugar O-acyltransferase (sialic acid O-acetyltransferase NeuD family)